MNHMKCQALFFSEKKKKKIEKKKNNKKEVIYSLAPISLPNIKAIAKILSEIPCIHVTLVLLNQTCPAFANSINPDQLKPNDLDLHCLSLSM